MVQITLSKKNLSLAVLYLCCCVGFSLGAESRGHSLVVVCGLHLLGASLDAQHRFWGAQVSVVAAHRLSSYGSRASEHRLGCSSASGSSWIRDQTQSSLIGR